MKSKRVFLIVLDACGIGAMPDWQAFEDPAGANTLANVAAQSQRLSLPNLEKLGLANIHPLNNLNPPKQPLASFGKAAALSPGKDTTTGHWEIAGLILDKPFPVYPKGFPGGIIEEFIKITGCNDVLGNIPASGTEILVQLGEKHIETGYPIVYTSADSVFQIATNVSKIPLETLYNWCELARQLLSGEHEVSRVIARPFEGRESRSFIRLSDQRRDYAIRPRGQTLLDYLQTADCETISVGKIKDIFCNQGIDRSLEGKSNAQCLANIHSLMQAKTNYPQFIFANLVETDSHYGHRNNVQGFAEALQKIDLELGTWLPQLKPDDLLILTADHGCDPTVAGTDHTREYIPILAYSPDLKPVNIGTRQTFADISASICQWFGLTNKLGIGQSFI